MNKSFSKSALLSSLGLVMALCATVHAQLPARPSFGPGGTNYSPIAPNPIAVVTPGLAIQDLSTGLTPTDLANSLVSGPGVTISNVSYVGNNISAGAFSTATTGIVGFNSGIVLSSGNVNSVAGPNMADNTTTNNGLGSDPDLQALIPGFTVNDTCILEFDFTTNSLAPGQAGAVNFNFVFSSEEYNEFVFTAFNDVFGFFLNGTNIALLQDLVTPVTIDNVNCGNPFNAPMGGNNCAQFRNNDLSDGGPFIDTEMDGLTIVLTAFGNITGPGPHHIKLAIADAGDFAFDSNVFIQGSSLVATAAPSCIAPTPTGTTQALIATPFSFEVRAVANNGTANASVTISPPTVMFQPLGAGPFLPVASPVMHNPMLPTTGQPASTIASWTPTNAQVGVWFFVYTLTDNLGQTMNCEFFINVAECFLLVSPVLAPQQVGPGANDILYVEPFLILPMTMQAMPQLMIPNLAQLVGFDVYVQGVLYNPQIFPNDPIKFSPTLKYKIGVNTTVVATNPNLVLQGTGTAQPGQLVPYNFAVPGF